jgi:hypothetical protein
MKVAYRRDALSRPCTALRMKQTKYLRAIRVGDVTISTLGRWNFAIVALEAVVATVLVLVLCPWLWQGWIDSYLPYSGTVVDKGIERHLLAVRGDPKYILLRDGSGAIEKRYVGDYGYAFTHIGTYVVKKKGFSEYPHGPNEKTPGELERELRRFKAR